MLPNWAQPACARVITAGPAQLSPVPAAALWPLFPHPALAPTPATLLAACVTPVLSFSQVSALSQTSAASFPAEGRPVLRVPSLTPLTFPEKPRNPSKPRWSQCLPRGFAPSSHAAPMAVDMTQPAAPRPSSPALLSPSPSRAWAALDPAREQVHFP